MLKNNNSQTMYNDFKTYLERYVAISEDEWSCIKSRLYVEKSQK
jgi:hypothetical protein